MVTLLSLTLRDAQHLSWKTLKKLEILDKTQAQALANGSELGKKACEIFENLKRPQTSEQKEQLGKLLSDVLFECFVTAEQNGVSLEDAFLQSIDELILRFVD
jgi:NTP pyrophosphatase (non-canonical NTP hydrolase)